MKDKEEMVLPDVNSTSSLSFEVTGIAETWLIKEDSNEFTAKDLKKVCRRREIFFGKNIGDTVKALKG